MCLDWMVKKFLKLPKGIIFTHVFAKFLFGVGLGALLASYCQGINWANMGWVLIIISVLLAIPGAYYMLKS